MCSLFYMICPGNPVAICWQPVVPKTKATDAEVLVPYIIVVTGTAGIDISSRKLALASWSCSCFSKLSDGVDAPQKPQIID